jgi:hypothetical protein
MADGLAVKRRPHVDTVVRRLSRRHVNRGPGIDGRPRALPADWSREVVSRTGQLTACGEVGRDRGRTGDCRGSDRREWRVSPGQARAGRQVAVLADRVIRATK